MKNIPIKLSISTLDNQSDTIIIKWHCDSNLKYYTNDNNTNIIASWSINKKLNRDYNCSLYYKNIYFIWNKDIIDTNYIVKYNEKWNMCLLYSKLDNNILFNFEYKLIIYFQKWKFIFRIWYKNDEKTFWIVFNKK